MASNKPYEELKKWHEIYKNLLDSLNIGVMLLDNNYVCLAINKFALELTGTREEYWLNQNISKHYTKEEFQRLYEIDQEVETKAKVQNLKATNFEWFAYNTNGEKIPVIIKNSYNYDKFGQQQGSWTIITDIRDQKKIQKELEGKNRLLTAEKKKLETILFGIGDSVTIFDTHSKIVMINSRGKEIRGGRKGPLIPLETSEQKEITVTAGGEQRKLQAQVFKIQDETEQITAYAEILKDISHQEELEEAKNELFHVKREFKQHEIKTEMIATSKTMQPVLDLITRCSEIDSNILILGETGSGKEITAKMIHNKGLRNNKPFVAVNCGALPETLLESELFGHIKGAFTGAVSDRKGLFREAHGGTLFLDEVGDISNAIQLKLLRAIQEKEIRPLGGDETFSVDVRIITATHQNLNQMVKDNRFRQDLFYRISVIPIFIPPLRHRKNDILPLAKHFIMKNRTKSKAPPVSMDQAFQQKLLQYSWPGNIRELENCIEYSMAMNQDQTLKTADLPIHISQDVASTTPFQETGRFMPKISDDSAANYQQTIIDALSNPEELYQWQIQERNEIITHLNRNKGNRQKTAAALGISRSTLWRKMKIFRIKT